MPRKGIAAKAFGLEEEQARKRRPGVAQGMQAKAFGRAMRAAPPASPAIDQAVPAQAPQAGISGAEIPGLGKQLTSRVNSGAIDQGQAEQTAHQRRVFEEAYGPDWRTKVYGGRGIVQANRKALAGPGEHPQAEAFRKQLMEERQRMLQAALEKLGR